MWSLSQLVDFVIPHIDCVPIKLNLLEKSGWSSHSLLTPDLVARASVDEARLTDAIQGFTLSYGQRCPHTPTEQSVSKTRSWPRTPSKSQRIYPCVSISTTGLLTQTLLKKQKVTRNLKMSLFIVQKA